MITAQRVRFRIKRYLREMHLRRVCVAPRTVKFQPSARIVNASGIAGAIKIGANSVIAGELLVYANCGRIEIGEFCFVGEGTRIWAASEITIGNRVLISHNVNVHDSISHSLSANERHDHFRKIFLEKKLELNGVPKDKIVIDDDVWIGFNVSIMRGVRIGRGAIVGIGAIVKKDVPPLAVVSATAGIQMGRALP